MARRKQSDLGDMSTRDRIIESARNCFLEYGFQAAPLRKIAEDAGFTSGALFGYFDSKEDLFYAITDPIAETVVKKLDEIRAEMDAQPEKQRLNSMGQVYYPHIPEIVDILLADRDATKLIVTGSKGTKHEGFLDRIADRNATEINKAATQAENAGSIEQQTMDILMDGYVSTLFNLITSGKDRDTIIKCMEAIGRVYEVGITALMKKEK